MRRSLITVLIAMITAIMLIGCNAQALADAAAVSDEQEETSDKDKSEKKIKNNSKFKKKKKGNKDNWETVKGDTGRSSEEDIYAPILDEVRDVLKNGYDYENDYDYVKDGIIERCMYPDGDDLCAVIGYYLEDLNDDGIKELLIGENDVNDNDKEVAYIYNGYSIVNDKPVSFLEGWARNRQHYLQDGYFFNVGSGGADNTIFGKWHLESDGTEAVWDDCYFSEYDEQNKELAIFHNFNGSTDMNDSERINMSEDVFLRTLRSYEDDLVTIEWTYFEGDGGSDVQSGDKVSDSELSDIEDKLNSIKYYGFLRSTYKDPRNIDWNEVFYVGAGIDQGNASDKVKKAYLRKTGYDEIMTDLTVIKGSDIEEFVEETTGYDYSEMKNPLDWVYIKDMDLYINEHGDTNQSIVDVKSAKVSGDEYTVTYTGEDSAYVVTFVDENGKYRFISNQPLKSVEKPAGDRNDQSDDTEGMIIPDSDSRKLTEDDLEGLSKKELRIARNEIYARHGRQFKDKELQAHFNSLYWYFPVDDGEFDDKQLSKIEKYNADFILKYEKNH